MVLVKVKRTFAIRFLLLSFSTIIEKCWFSNGLEKLFLFKYVFSIYNYNRIDKEKQPQLINGGESISIFMDFIREKNLKPIVFWAHMPVKEERFFGHLHRMHREFR